MDPKSKPAETVIVQSSHGGARIIGDVALAPGRSDITRAQWDSIKNTHAVKSLRESGGLTVSLPMD